MSGINTRDALTTNAHRVIVVTDLVGRGSIPHGITEELVLLLRTALLLGLNRFDNLVGRGGANGGFLEKHAGNNGSGHLEEFFEFE